MFVFSTGMDACRIVIITAMLSLGGLSVNSAVAQPAGSFSQFIDDFAQKAIRVGVSPQLYAQLTSGMSPDPRTPNLIARQPEFTTPIWQYMDTRVSAGRVSRGRRAVANNRALLDQMGERFGVDPFILAAIWGMETDYGAILSNKKFIRPIVRSLATVAHQRRGRVKEDEAELIAALLLIQQHKWTNDTLVGSWAGAVGHTQLIVSGVLEHGIDGNNDGVVNPHVSLADALASTANYLRSLGYKSGQDWGYEVTLPKGFDYSLATRESFHTIGYFSNLGVARVSGRQFNDPNQRVFLYVPAGINGPKFLMTENYLVLKGYNFSDSYALSVAHLTDRLKGGGVFVSNWPKATKFPNLAQRIFIQKALRKLGYYTGDVDGRIGPISQFAYQKFQAKHGLTADGFITLDAVKALEAALR